MAKNNRLTVRQTRALSAVITCPSLTAAAATCGVSLRQLQRWMTQSNFRQALDDQVKDLQLEVNRRLAGLQSPALDILEQQLSDSDVSDNVRQRAALEVLRMSAERLTWQGIEERIRVLELELNNGIE